MKQLLAGVVYCLIVFGVHAQSASNLHETYSLAWHSGKVVFETGDTLQGKVRYNHAAAIDIFQVKLGDTVVTLPPKDVRMFLFYDENKERIRRFEAVPVSGDQEFFLETIYNDNRFSILMHRTRDIPFEYQNYTRLISKPVKMWKKYIRDESTGELVPLSKENALKLLAGKQDEVQQYIREHHLRFKRTADYIHLFRYHSSL